MIPKLLTKESIRMSVEYSIIGEMTHAEQSFFWQIYEMFKENKGVLSQSELKKKFGKTTIFSIDYIEAWNFGDQNKIWGTKNLEKDILQAGYEERISAIAKRYPNVAKSPRIKE